MTDTPADRLWAPLLTHYALDGGHIRIDRPRMAAHIRHVRPFLKQFLLAGSTGDGWEMTDEMLGDLIDFAHDEVFEGTTVIIGALGQTTADVVRRAQLIESGMRQGKVHAQFHGLTICPPVNPAATPPDVLAHYRSVLEATESPIAAYELPQVTGCSLTPETLASLIPSKRVVMFKDTSGADVIAKAAVGGVILLRGAEGGYAEALAPRGDYHGWLLSTGNTFAPALRRILDFTGEGSFKEAQRLSRVLTSVVEAAFDAAGSATFGNVFSNANRGIDHLLAHGPHWRQVQGPLTLSGNRLPRDILERLRELLSLAGPAGGYLALSGRGG